MGLFGNGIHKSKLKTKLNTLATLINHPELIERIYEHLTTKKLQQLSSIDILDLESEFGIDRRQIIRAMLHATKLQIFDFEYVLNCKSCKGQAGLQNLSDSLHIMPCPSCSTLVRTNLTNNLDVRFKINKTIGRQKAPTPHKRYIRAIEILNTNEFRQLFEKELPLPGEHINIDSLTFLFTDLTGSTATYEKLGDSSAYRLVKEHFTLLFDKIRTHQGSVVKTMGDAVMATFLKPQDAFACALEISQECKTFNKRKDIKGHALLKIGIHTGNCLAVTLNNKLDYFGSTVNTAARIQGLASKEEITMSKSVFDACKHMMDDVKFKHSTATLKGIKIPLRITTAKYSPKI